MTINLEIWIRMSLFSRHDLFNRYWSSSTISSFLPLISSIHLLYEELSWPSFLLLNLDCHLRLHRVIHQLRSHLHPHLLRRRSMGSVRRLFHQLCDSVWKQSFWKLTITHAAYWLIDQMYSEYEWVRSRIYQGGQLRRAWTRPSCEISQLLSPRGR